MTSLDTLLNKSLVHFSFESYGKALLAINALDSEGELLLLECLSRAGATDLLLLGNANKAREFELKICSEFKATSCLIENPHKALIKALLNLENSNVQESLVVFESLSLSQCLQATQVLLSAGFQIVDFKMPRSGNAPVVVTATTDLKTVKTVRQLIDPSLHGHITVIEQATKELKSYFDLSPKA